MKNTTAPLAGSPKCRSTRLSESGREEISQVTPLAPAVGRMDADLVARRDPRPRPSHVTTVPDEPGSLEHGFEAGVFLREAGQDRPNGRAGRRHFSINRGGSHGFPRGREESNAYRGLHEGLRRSPEAFEAMVRRTTPNGYVCSTEW